MIVTKLDYDNIDGIDFLDIDITESNLNVEIVRQGKPLTTVEYLASRFKAELSMINKPFMRDEDNELFKPLRKYYASAIRHTLTSHDPSTDIKYNTLSTMGIGLEKYYYETIVVPTLIDEVYKLFFIDMNHKLLYNFVDGMDTRRLDGLNDFYGSLNWEHRIKKAIKPNDKLFGLSDKKRKDMVDKSGLGDLFKDTWIDEYNHRLGIIFSKQAQNIVNKSVKDFKSMSELAKALVD